MGTTYYRIYFTGYLAPPPAPSVLADLDPKYYEEQSKEGKLLYYLLSQVGTSIKAEVESIGDVLSEVSSEISELRNTVNSLTSTMYASMGISCYSDNNSFGRCLKKAFSTLIFPLFYIYRASIPELEEDSFSN